MFQTNHYFNRKKLLTGIQLINPFILFQWNMEENEFVNLFRCYDVKYVAEHGYFMEKVIFIGEQYVNIGISFSRVEHSYPKNDTYHLQELSLSRWDYGTGTEKEMITRSYNDFQSDFEKEYGKPTTKETGSFGFDTCIWLIDNKVKIRHSVFERFSLEEHMTIEYISYTHS